MVYYKKKTNVSYPSRLSKRWYVDASIPKSIPFVGGTSFRAGSGTLNKRSLTSLIKREARLTNIVKYKASAPQSVGLLAGTWHTLNPLGNIPQAIGDVSRIGTDIFVKSIKLKSICYSNTALVGQPSNAPVHFRVIWLRSTVNVLQSSDAFGSGLGNADLILQGNSAPITSILDMDKITLLSDTTYTIPQSNIAAGQVSTSLDLSCPLKNFPYKYASTTSNYSNANKNVYCLVTPFIVGDVTGTTTDMTMYYQFATEFTDAA